MCQQLSYEGLKAIAINDTTAKEHLEDIKYQFRNEIGSARNMYRIRTIADLIDCLERHDALSEFNIEPLREIADEFSHSLEEAIACYNVPKELSRIQPINEYRGIRLAHECRMRLSISDGNQINGFNAQSLTNYNTTPALSNAATIQQQPVFAQPLGEEKRSAIYKLVAQNIGTFWRALGRELNINQGDMDEIEIQYPRDLKSRVYKLFQVFEEDATVDPKQHLLLICQALDNCRRKDLRRKIESIMSH